MRVGAGKSLRGRSQCPHCKSTLQWYDLVPIVSFCLLRGRCRRCHASIAVRYILMEVIMGSLFVFALMLSQYEPWHAMALMILLFALLLIVVFDIHYQAIPDSFTAIVFLGALLWQGAEGPSVGSVLGALTAFLWFGIQWLPGRGKYVGSGDIFLAASLGVWLEWRGTVLMLFLSYIVGMIVCGYLLLTRRIALHGTRIPFAPFLAIGAVVSFLIVEDVWRYLLG